MSRRKERKGRRDLNHGIHESGVTGRCTRSAAILSPLSSVVRPASLAGGCWRSAAGKSEFGVCGVVGGMMVIELLAGTMRLDRGGIVAVEMR